MGIDEIVAVGGGEMEESSNVACGGESDDEAAFGVERVASSDDEGASGGEGGPRRDGEASCKDESIARGDDGALGEGVTVARSDSEDVDGGVLAADEAMIGRASAVAIGGRDEEALDTASGADTTEEGAISDDVSITCRVEIEIVSTGERIRHCTRNLH